MKDFPGASLIVGRDGQNGIKISSRMEFNISKTESSFANKAKIKLWNLSSDTISRIQKENSFLTLMVRHEGFDKLLFTGDIDKTSVISQGADDILSIETGDGEKKLRASLEFEIESGKPKSEAFHLAAAALGVPVGVIKGLPDTPVKRFWTYAGSAKDLLNLLCRQHKLKWSIQNGVLQILPESEKLNLSAVILSQETGLLDGISKDDDKHEINGSCRLNPGITPGRIIELTSEKYAGAIDAISGKSGGTGLFKVISLTHKGDPDGSLWETSFTAVMWAGGQ